MVRPHLAKGERAFDNMQWPIRYRASKGVVPRALMIVTS